MIQKDNGFWGRLAKPIVALAPMDGVTDVVCRTMAARHGRPDIIFTEFTSAEGLFHAPDRLLRDFEYNEIERPVVAQLYGHRPEDFYRAAHIVCELGFDGVDINMGCPSKSVTQKNCGAKLITAPALALEIIRATRTGIEDWAQGQTLEDLKISEKVLRVVYGMNSRRDNLSPPLNLRGGRGAIPISVKTRLGYDSVVIEWWVEQLLKEKPVTISIHGRTLKQMYKGSADWEAIGRAAQVAKGSGTLVLGNGDVNTLEEAGRRILESGVDGVLLGRSTIGNPWIFQNKEAFKKIVAQGKAYHEPDPPVATEERLRLALEHIRNFTELRGEYHFNSVKKHLHGYLSHFPEASALRLQAMRTKQAQELVTLLEQHRSAQA